MYPTLNIYISEPILERYWYIPVASATVHCIIWPWLKLLSLDSWVQDFFQK